ncbi:hypothetical protein HN747_03515 [archaeon]|nr:hypothetical protein [archaeon]
MKTEIISEEKNPFLERTELTVKITEEVAPTKEELIQSIGKDSELTIVRRINSNFGSGEFSADLVVYDNLEAKDKYMTIPKKVREKMEAEKKAAEEAKKKEEADKKAEEAKAAEEAAKAEEPAATEEPVAEVAKEETIEENKAEAAE